MKKLIILLGSMLVLAGCGTTVSYYDALESNEEAVSSLIKNDTIPKIERSLERENLKRRVEFINQPDRVGYVYLLSETGQLVREVPVKGKVSSLNSYLTPMEEIRYSGDAVVQAADIDGTWGENDNGIFWFTPDGVYQEWTGLYLYSSERMSFDVKPVLMEVVEDE